MGINLAKDYKQFKRLLSLSASNVSSQLSDPKDSPS